MGVGFEVAYAHATPSDTVHFLLPVDQDVELLAPSPDLRDIWGLHSCLKPVVTSGSKNVKADRQIIPG